jgi:eukaryotic-like serine/threonine-protein kinase
MSLLSTEETERRAQEQVGKTLNAKYRLDQLLGVGGMAAVYAASHRNGNRVAIKLLYPELTLSADVLVRFIREGYAANRVGHPGAVRVLDDDKTADGSVFLVMELLEGEAVDAIQFSRGGRISVTDLLPWIDQLLDVLAAAHEHEIVHRDIKPENLFITWGGALKVLDFGIARMKSAPSSSVTRTGNQFGTPPFMSPEQALGRMKEIDARSDLYSVGATMFFLLTGQDVHPAESANEMLVLAATRPARSLSSVLPDVPSPVAYVVDRALAFDRGERWQDARAMQNALREAYQEVFGEPMPSVPAALESARSSSRSLKVRSVRSSGPKASVSAETQAGPTSSLHPVVRKEFHATAPPTSAVAERSPGQRRWLMVVGAGLAVALGAAFFVLPGSRPKSDTDSAALPAAAPPVGASASSATPPPPVAGPAPSPSAPNDTPPSTPPTGAPSSAPPASPAAATPATPSVRKKPRPTSSPSRPVDNSAFEHQ